MRKIVAGPGGQSLLVVLYDVASHVNGKDLGVSVPPGKRVMGVKIGLQNRSSRTYSNTPAATATIRTDDGVITRALRLKATGLGKVVLKKRQTALGRLFFLVGREASFQVLALKPFAPNGILVRLGSKRLSGKSASFTVVSPTTIQMTERRPSPSSSARYARR